MSLLPVALVSLLFHETMRKIKPANTAGDQMINWVEKQENKAALKKIIVYIQAFLWCLHFACEL